MGDDHVVKAEELRVCISQTDTMCY